MKNTEEVLHAFTLPSYQEIPDVGLYLEQVSRYINNCLKDYPEMMLTPSMISNYVKLKIVAKANKKAYSRDQIACFLFIALAKNVLSMDQIRQAFALQQNTADIETVYEIFRKELTLTLQDLDHRGEAGEDTRAEEKILSVIVITIAYKMVLDLSFKKEKD